MSKGRTYRWVFASVGKRKDGILQRAAADKTVAGQPLSEADQAGKLLKEGEKPWTCRFIFPDSAGQYNLQGFFDFLESLDIWVNRSLDDMAFAISLCLKGRVTARLLRPAGAQQQESWVLAKATAKRWTIEAGQMYLLHMQGPPPAAGVRVTHSIFRYGTEPVAAGWEVVFPFPPHLVQFFNLLEMLDVYGQDSGCLFCASAALGMCYERAVKTRA